MWGGNIPSTLAGEFTFSLGLALAVLFLGTLRATIETGRGRLVERAAGGDHRLVARLHAALGRSQLARRSWSRPAAGGARRHAGRSCTGSAFCSWGSGSSRSSPTRPGRRPTATCGSSTRGGRCCRRSSGRAAGIAAFAALVLGHPLAPCAASPSRAGSGAELWAATIIGDRALLHRAIASTWSTSASSRSSSSASASPRRAGLGYLLAAPAAARGSGRSLGGARRSCRSCSPGSPSSPSWITLELLGLRGRRRLWPVFKAVNEHLRGDFRDPRVVYEHSSSHEPLGTIRAFENLPLFSGRSTLEGLYMQASPTAPFVFYTQSEISKEQSCPFPDYGCSRLNLDRGIAPPAHVQRVAVHRAERRW